MLKLQLEALTLELSPMTLTVRHDLDSCKVNDCTSKYLNWRTLNLITQFISYCLDCDTQTHTHTGPIALRGPLT